MVTSSELFAQVVEFPDPGAQERFDALVGVDDIKRRVVTEAKLLLDPNRLAQWSMKHHRGEIRAAHEVIRRTPLLVLAGDVGTGKTEVAETFADPVARQMRVDITLFPLSLSARGRGAVGEMTTLLTAAFAEVTKAASNARDADGKARRGVVLLVDEADALAQSRDLTQMHHEDRAGVNALIRGIDHLRNERLPVLTMLCTNRLDALDPAVTRRAARVIPFERPNDEQRRQLLQSLLVGCTVSTDELEKLVSLTGGGQSRPYGCTFSDIRQRLVPEALLDAVARDVPITGRGMIELAEVFEPTRPFGDAA